MRRAQVCRASTVSGVTPSPLRTISRSAGRLRSTSTVYHASGLGYAETGLLHPHPVPRIPCARRPKLFRSSRPYAPVTPPPGMATLPRMDDAGIPALQEAIKHLHGCDATWVESVPVRE